MLTWRELIVTELWPDGDTVVLGTLGFIANSWISLLRDSVDDKSLMFSEAGEIIQWVDYRISAPNEIASDDTPLLPVNWDGFLEILEKNSLISA